MVRFSIIAFVVGCGSHAASPAAAPATAPGPAPVPVAVPVPAPVAAAAPAVALSDGVVCPPGSRAAVEACLGEHGFCARDVQPLEPQHRDLVVVMTTGAIDCAGYYVLAASGGQWAVVDELHIRRHNDPQYGDLHLGKLLDDPKARVTRIEYTVDAADDETATPMTHVTKCSWPAAGWPTCAFETVRIAP